MRWISALAPTSMPRVGWSRIRTRGLRDQPLGQQHLLLVAAGERVGQLLDAGRDHAHALGELARRRSASAARSTRPKPVREPPQHRQRRRWPGSGTAAPAPAGAGPRAAARCRARMRILGRARLHGRGRRSGSRPASGGVMPNSICGDLGAAGADQPEKAQDLAGRAARSSRPRRSRRRTGRARSSTGAPIVASSLGKKAPGSVPIMCRHRLLGRQLGGRAGDDPPAGAQDGDVVAQSAAARR